MLPLAEQASGPESVYDSGGGSASTISGSSVGLARLDPLGVWLESIIRALIDGGLDETPLPPPTCSSLIGLH